ncbi:MAG: transglutaminase domain-containing protein [Isosphaeraceae bacterium]|nr:transglutaminase domain-containing protein [Isosphaeraceae bacterium]
MSVAAKIHHGKEPMHLLAVRLPVYAGLAVLAVGPIAPGAGLAAALAGVMAGLWAGRELAASSLRGPVVAVLGLAVIGLGLVAERLVGGPAWVADLLGYRTALIVGEALTFGLIAAGLVAGSRALAARTPFCGAIEVALVAALVVGTFAGHRDAHLGRPQFFSDWALSHGHDPVQALVGVGLAGSLACALLLLRPQRPGRTVVSALTLVALVLLLLFLLWRFMPEYHKPADPPVPDAEPAPQPKPRPDQNSDDGTPPPQPVPIAIVNLLDDLDDSAQRLYFRQAAQSQLIGTHLVAAGSALDGDVPRAFPTTRVECATAPIDGSLVAEVSQRISLLVDLAHPFGLIDPRAIEAKRVADPKIFRRTYHVTSRVLTVPLNRLADRKAGDPAWPSTVREHYLDVPADPRYKALAERIVAEAIDDAKLKPIYRGSPALRALALMRWIEEHTTYSKHPEPSPDTTAAFVFDKKPGKCTEVAHALVFMLRSLGIPARAAAGFAAPTSRLGTGSYLLLQDTDAHQWCEVYLEGVGWVVADRSPAATITAPDPEPDPVTQGHYGEKNREPEAAVVDRMRDEERRASAWAIRPVPVMGFSVLVPLAVLYAVKLWRRLAPRWASDRALDRVAYRATVDRLAEVGLVRGFGETRAEFAERVATLVPEFVALSAAHERRAITGETRFNRVAWLELAGRVVDRLGDAFPRHTRAIGVLNPVSWLAAR